MSPIIDSKEVCPADNVSTTTRELLSLVLTKALRVPKVSDSLGGISRISCTCYRDSLPIGCLRYCVRRRRRRRGLDQLLELLEVIIELDIVEE